MATLPVDHDVAFTSTLPVLVVNPFARPLSQSIHRGRCETFRLCRQRWDNRMTTRSRAHHCARRQIRGEPTD